MNCEKDTFSQFFNSHFHFLVEYIDKTSDNDLWAVMHGCEHMVGGFTTIDVISAYHLQSCEFESR